MSKLHQQFLEEKPASTKAIRRRDIIIDAPSYCAGRALHGNVPVRPHYGRALVETIRETFAAFEAAARMRLLTVHLITSTDAQPSKVDRRYPSVRGSFVHHSG